MNEEIVLGMGLDATAFAVGKRKITAMVKEMKDEAGELKEMFKSALEGFGVGFGVAKIIEGGRAIAELATHIINTSEDIGVSTDYLQQFNYAAQHTGASAEQAEKGLAKLSATIGEAREGSKEAADKFIRWGISLSDAAGNARDLESVADELSKRFESIEDPALRDAAAVELLGKAGVKLVQTFKEFAGLKDQSKGQIISKADLQQLNEANEQLEQTSGFWKVWGARTLNAAMSTVDVLNPWSFYHKSKGTLKAGRTLSASEDAELQMRQLQRDEENKKNGFSPENVAKAEAMAKALEKLNEVRDKARTAGMSTQEKVSELAREELELRRKMEEAAAGSIDKIKAQTEYEEKHRDLLNEEKKLKTELAEKDAKSLQMNVEIARARETAGHAQEELSAKRDSRWQFTIEELANSRRRFGGTLGDDQWTAREILGKESQARGDKALGNLDDAKARLSEADELRKKLSTNVTEGERDPLKQLEFHQKEAAEHLKTLVDKASREGIKIIPQMGK